MFGSPFPFYFLILNQDFHRIKSISKDCPCEPLKHDNPEGSFEFGISLVSIVVRVLWKESLHYSVLLHYSLVATIDTAAVVI